MFWRLEDARCEMRLHKRFSALLKHAPTHVSNQDLFYTDPRPLICYMYSTTTALAGAGISQFVRSRTNMIVSPRISTVPGRSTSGVHQPGRHCLQQARSSVRCPSSCTKSGLHPSNNYSSDGLGDFVPIFFVVDESANELFFSCCGHSGDINRCYENILNMNI